MLRTKWNTGNVKREYKQVIFCAIYLIKCIIINTNNYIFKNTNIYNQWYYIYHSDMVICENYSYIV